MDTDDLFSFLGGDPSQNDHEGASASKESTPVPNEKSGRSSKKKKRKAQAEVETDEPPADVEDSPKAEEENEAESSDRALKKLRLGSPKAVVVDEIEIQAGREVPVNAGLTGGEPAEAGQTLRLTHQVKFMSPIRFPNLLIILLPLGSTPSCRSTRIPIHPHRPTRLSDKTRPCISIHS